MAKKKLSKTQTPKLAKSIKNDGLQATNISS